MSNPAAVDKKKGTHLENGTSGTSKSLSTSLPGTSTPPVRRRGHSPSRRGGQEEGDARGERDVRHIQAVVNVTASHVYATSPSSWP
jgi:hypothetical protein